MIDALEFRYVTWPTTLILIKNLRNGCKSPTKSSELLHLAFSVISTNKKKMQQIHIMHNIMSEQVWAVLLSIQGQTLVFQNIISCVTHAICILTQVDFSRRNAPIQNISPTIQMSQEIHVYWHQKKWSTFLKNFQASNIEYIMHAFDPLCLMFNPSLNQYNQI